MCVITRVVSVGEADVTTEAWLAIEMMREGWFSPTINLTDIDPECGELDYITGTERRIDTEFVQSNNFAFGGINTSLIFKRM